MALNVQGLQGRWNHVKGEVKKRWGQLSDDDLSWAGGNIDQLVGRIQQRTGETREAIESFLGQLTSEGGSTISAAAQSVGSYVHDVSHRLRDHYGDVSQRAQEGFVTVRDTVSQNPMRWVGIAFGVGVLTGVLTGLSLSRSGSSHRRFI
jgi:uncharacterized protein YjbJ (UPF0337 family)